MENELHQNPATPEEIWATLDRITKKQEKAAEEAEKRRKEADRRMKKLGGLFTSQWGALVESLVEGNLVVLWQDPGLNPRIENHTGHAQ